MTEKATKIQDGIKDLALARQVEAECKAEVANIQTQLEASWLWQTLTQHKAILKSASEAANQQADYVRELALAAYNEAGNKNPHTAVKIKMYTVLAYDEKEALDFCRDCMPDALKLDRHAFEKVAKDSPLVDFVTITKEPRATIARDLSEYAEQEATGE